ncbi:MAG: DNA translocase FtsK [Candidatus Latescibacteria bacterium]|nr:DNA translocase FtsK [bacterium]MBD3424819.1 DNA translocase FtsK [Candidatus Latescibacterota bacterium]
MNKKEKISKGILLIIASVFVGLALASFDIREWGMFWDAKQNLCGPAGVYIGGVTARGLGTIFGWMVPAFLLFWGVLYFRDEKITGYGSAIIRSFLLLFFAACLLHAGGLHEESGLLAGWTFSFLEMVTGTIGSWLVLSAAFMLSVVMLFHHPIRRLASQIRSRLKGEIVKKKDKKPGKKQSGKSGVMAQAKEQPPRKREKPKIDIPKKVAASRKRETRQKMPPSADTTAADNAPLPDLDILEDIELDTSGCNEEDLIVRSQIIESKLADFGLQGEVKQVKPGPVVTTFEFVPAAGVRISQIVNRSDDLSLALAAKAIRIQAPIPGKGAVGIEVPNPKPEMVYIKEMLQHCPPDDGGLVVALGKTVTGEPYFADISQMPHLLVAGATGSGKSVCINSIITSLLFNHTPATCRFILIDPKRLELVPYKGIPHLLHPVITDAEDTLKVMNWLTIEMDRRYRKLARFGVKNIASFNRMVECDNVVDEETGEKLGKLPYHVTIIDELADIMLSVGNEIYPTITRLSQMARAVGIHLVFSTQRPSVDVVTGLIKANFPSRIAFQVTSKTDSRTILDVNGAESLLGNGDMLYLPKDLPNPVRIQGSFISERDAAAVAGYWKGFEKDGEKIDLTKVKGKKDVGDVECDDELLDKARELVIIHQQGSISLLQRRLRVGYARAARLVDMLEEIGVVGPYEGSKARKVLISREEYERSG